MSNKKILLAQLKTCPELASSILLTALTKGVITVKEYEQLTTSIDKQLEKKKTERKAKDDAAREVRNDEVLESAERKKLAVLPSIDASVDSKTDTVKLDKEAQQDALDRQKCMPLINASVSKLANIYPHSLLVIAGPTGTGKSTATAAAAIAIINSEKRVLIVSNEEREIDVYQRMACTMLGVSRKSYSSGQLDPQTTLLVKNKISELAKSPMLRVIDSRFKDRSEFVMTTEGILSTIEKLAPNFDVVIIDYFQKVTVNKPGGVTNDNEAQSNLALGLDNLRKSTSLGIVIFGQCHKNNGEVKLELEKRWKGRKKLLEVATDVIEICARFSTFTTVFKCSKSRDNGTRTCSVKCGLDLNSFSSYVENPEHNPLWMQQRALLNINKVKV